MSWWERENKKETSSIRSIQKARTKTASQFRLRSLCVSQARLAITCYNLFFKHISYLAAEEEARKERLRIKYNDRRTKRRESHLNRRPEEVEAMSPNASAGMFVDM